MSIEYLGSKRRLIEFLMGPICSIPGASVVADLFCGTASVSLGLKARGMRVIANDHMKLCATLAEAALLTDGAPPFRGLASVQGGDCNEGAYHAALRTLNALPPVSGFFHQTYSPESVRTGVMRMYLTEANAAKVDAIRAQINEWEPLLTRAERAVLLRDFVTAVSAVSNTAGTYGCYLKTWKQRALEPLRLRPGAALPAELANYETQHHEVRCEDAEVAASTLPGVDIVYLDPPYTKRQYAAYYHLLETLVTGATPEVEGSTGLPRWQDKQSDFCHRKRAPRALERLILRIDAPHVFLSYSGDGHITHEEILGILASRGTVRSWERSSQRYRSSSLRHSATIVRERLYHLAVA